ncbi:MAG TPA: FHA domain-containing protein [Gemmataceae bacterium]|nr:FHA domain-containing protein [Gemmataceae bacterium]
MAKVTFQVLEGIDKGRVYRDLPTPVTMGREEGNGLRLNDERVSRFHAKIQQDGDDIILTDLDSTNGTRVNNSVVQIRRLRHGDRVCLGRSILLFGSNEEIAARMMTMAGITKPPALEVPAAAPKADGPATVQAQTMDGMIDNAADFDLNIEGKTTATSEALFIGNRALPPLPQKMSPSQNARLAEILDFLHRGLHCATDNVQAKDDGSLVSLTFADWQRVLGVQMLLARYLRAVAEPETLTD